MHKWAKEIMENVKAKVNAKGIDNIEGCELEELETWACIADKIAEMDYYYHITSEMEKPENKYGMNYDERGRYYTDQPRNSQGEFMRRNYEMYDPNMRRGIENYRDMDYSSGRMYYTDMNNMSGRSESNYERARRGFEESKDMNPSEEYMHELAKNV